MNRLQLQVKEGMECIERTEKELPLIEDGAKKEKLQELLHILKISQVKIQETNDMFIGLGLADEMVDLLMADE